MNYANMPENNSLSQYPAWQRFAAWGVHFLTASTAVIGLYTLKAIYDGQYILSFWLMAIAIFIDSIDGSLARKVRVKETAARIDGTLLDNIVDYLNYVITPGFFLFIHPTLLPNNIWREIVVGAIALAWAYQFTQSDAKTDDHFFKGFPCYWNFAVFYLFVLALPQYASVGLLLLLTILVFVPIKYVYPSRMDHLTRHQWLRRLMLLLSIGYGLAGFGLLLTYPEPHQIFVSYSVAYIALYFAFSLYRTFVPLPE